MPTTAVPFTILDIEMRLVIDYAESPGAPPASYIGVVLSPSDPPEPSSYVIFDIKFYEHHTNGWRYASSILPGSHLWQRIEDALNSGDIDA